MAGGAVPQPHGQPRASRGSGPEVGCQCLGQPQEGPLGSTVGSAGAAATRCDTAPTPLCSPWGHSQKSPWPRGDSSSNTQQHTVGPGIVGTHSHTAYTRSPVKQSGCWSAAKGCQRLMVLAGPTPCVWPVNGLRGLRAPESSFPGAQIKDPVHWASRAGGRRPPTGAAAAGLAQRTDASSSSCGCHGRAASLTSVVPHLCPVWEPAGL